MTATITREQRAIAKAELDMARRFGLGGASWRVSRVSGDGVTAPVTTTVVGVWAGYVADEGPATLEISATGATAAHKKWYAVSTSAVVKATPPALDTTVKINDTLTSVTDATAYTVAGEDRVAGYVRYLLVPL